MQKIYLSQLLVLLGIPIWVLFAFLLGGLSALLLVFFLAFSCLMAAVILEVLARHTAILNERDRQIRKSAFDFAFRLFFLAFFLGPISLNEIDQFSEIRIAPKDLGSLLIWGGFWLLFCLRDVAGLILYRRVSQ